MSEEIKERGIQALNNEAEKIKKLLTNQRNYQCIAQCKAFEEVVDTQMYGFSKQVAYAQEIGIVDKEQGNSLIIELEKELNAVYSAIYDEHKQLDTSL